MKVTPRLPIHGRYQDSAYVEMRYIRNDSLSFHTAMLFALVEECSFPHFAPEQAKIKALARSCTGETSWLLTMSLAKDTEASLIVAAWNEGTCAEDVVESFRLGSLSREDVVQQWSDRYRLHVVKFGAEHAANPEWNCIYWDEDGQNVVLLYTEYGMESFVVLDAISNHIHLKSALYRQAREAFGQPRSLAELSTVRISCEQCQGDFAAKVFSLAKEDAGMTQLRFSHASSVQVIGSSTQKDCQRCNRRIYEPVCAGKTCRICVVCVTIASLTKHGMSCYTCGGRYLPETLAKIATFQRKITDIAAGRDSARCRACSILKPVSEFTAIAISAHRHWLCDACVIAMQLTTYSSSERWMCCTDYMTGDDLEKLKAWLKTTSIKRPTNTEGGTESTSEMCCMLCSQIAGHDNYFYQRRIQHQCQICDKCYLQKLQHFDQCVFCSQPITGNSIESTLCPACNIFQKLTKFRIQCFLEHSCRTCDDCVFSNIHACMSCFKPYSDKDATVLLDKKDIEVTEGQLCGCGNRKSGGRVRCQRQCVCAVCTLKRMLLASNTMCPTCVSPYSGELPPTIPCSFCFRSIATTNATQLTVSGICAKGHILCPHCVKVEGEGLSCPVCNTSVEGRPASELALAQRKLFLACYCEDSGSEDLIEAQCTHVVHKKCRGALYACRICRKPFGFFRQKEPANVTIWELAKSRM